MSELADQIVEDLKAAQRAREKERTATLRLLLSELKNAGIDKRSRKNYTSEVDSPIDYLTNDDVITVLRSALKRRREAAEQYEAGGRQELASKEAAEAAIIEGYLPKAMDPAALEALVREAIESTGATTMKDMGAVMGKVMPKVGKAADGKSVSDAVRRLLG